MTRHLKAVYSINTDLIRQLRACVRKPVPKFEMRQLLWVILRGAGAFMTPLNSLWWVLSWAPSLTLSSDINAWILSQGVVSWWQMASTGQSPMTSHVMCRWKPLLSWVVIVQALAIVWLSTGVGRGYWCTRMVGSGSRKTPRGELNSHAASASMYSSSVHLYNPRKYAILHSFGVFLITKVSQIWSKFTSYFSDDIGFLIITIHWV